MINTDQTNELTTDEKAILPDGPKRTLMERMFAVGAHYGYGKSRRHPSAKKYIFGTKNKTEIFDLDKTGDELEKAKEFVKSLAQGGKTILFVSSKPEAKKFIRETAESILQPYVVGRWIGGTLTNFESIKKRAEKFVDLSNKKEKGELGKYTKKEKLLISRDIDALENKFGGITTMSSLPSAIFIIDLKKEIIAVKEANAKRIPIISLSSTDCDLSDADYPIPGNDSTQKSIEFFLNEIREAYRSGKSSVKN